VLKAKAAEQTVVMVADDSKVVRIKTGRLLSAHKYQVVMAEDGLDAAKQIDNSLPDLLITDVDMPGMGGLQLVRHLRANPRSAGIPIIMVTADSEVLRKEALESGVNVLLGKPYPEEQLIAHIQRLVMVPIDA
jgi:CheY-like chemotaxis protein